MDYVPLPFLFHHPHWVIPLASHHPGQSRWEHNGRPRLDIAYGFLPHLTLELVGAAMVPVRQLTREGTSRANIHRHAHPRNLLKLCKLVDVVLFPEESRQAFCIDMERR